MRGPRRLERDVPRRYGIGPWAFLAATDVVAVSTLARCFSGPGELVLAIPTCVCVHLLAGGGRRLATRRALHPRATAEPPRDGESPARDRPRLLGALGWAAAVVVGFIIPLVALDWHSFSYALPLAGSWHVVDGQLGAAWSIFSNKLAPVVEAPGLVLATAWAAGAVALASEVLYADVGLPAILALVPAFDVVVFTGTLGTSTGRAVELAGLAGLALAFLMTSQADRQTRRTVVMARTDAGQSDGGRAASNSARRRAIPGVTVVAALAAGVLGPVLPGATSPPIVAWHGVAARKGDGGSGIGIGGNGPNKISVSDLVQVAEQEVENSDGLLFTVHSTVRTRETLLTLDRFNGDSWSRAVGRGAGQSLSVPTFKGGVSQLERHPLAPKVSSSGTERIDQVIDIAGLGGSWLPSPGEARGVNGDGDVSEVGANGPLVAQAPLTANLTYAVSAELPPTLTSRSGLNAVPGIETNLQQDLQLPSPVPARVVALAEHIVAGADSPLASAELLQDYFLSGNGFVYHLPTITPSGAIADTSDNYAALQSFLFHSRVGYCQQYATAFAVLARIDGLPTRIAVGFLPGKSIGPDEYIVTGSEVHAWPEVYLAGYGWETFEPTPGAPTPSSESFGTTTTTVPGGTKSSTPVTSAPAHNFQPPKSGGVGVSRPTSHHHATGSGRGGGSSGATDVVLALLALGLAWAIAVPLWRLFRRRRDRRDDRLATLAAWRSATWALAAASAHRRRAETHLEFAARVRNLGLLTSEGSEALERLAHRMDRALYAPERGERTRKAESTAAWTESALVRRSARRRIAWWQQLAMLVDPRDLLGPS